MDEAATSATPDSPPAFLDLVELARDLRRRWFWPAIGALLGVAIAFVILNLATPKYTVILRLAPASSTQNPLAGTLGRLGGLASLAGVQVRPGTEGASNFELFLDRLRSRALAEELAQDRDLLRGVFAQEWDEAAQRFHERPRLLRPIRGLVYALAGQPEPSWTPPGPDRLQRFIEKELTIIQPGPKDPPITLLRVRFSDPAFGIRFLAALHQQADRDIRSQSLARSKLYAAHLAAKLNETEVAEHRAVLSEALLEQQRSVMMATTPAPFAAVPLEPPTSSDRPTSPAIVPTLLAGLTVGLVAGLLAVVVAHVLGRRPRMA